jgi:hypothetical protein
MPALFGIISTTPHNDIKCVLIPHDRVDATL